MTKVLITGAAGFVGRALVRAWAARESGEALLLDRSIEAVGPRLTTLSGDLTDAKVSREAAAFAPDAVFHLASAPGGLSEREPAIGRRANLDASLDLFEALAATKRRPRVVYASSIAVYGEMSEAAVNRDTACRPAITYGAHKRMVEIALADFTRRGSLSGVALRLPGVIARSEGAGFGSAFMSELPRAFLQNRPYVCPVSPAAVAWWASAPCVAANLLHAAQIDATGVFQLPALRLTVAEIVDTLAGLYGEARRTLISYAPDPAIEAVYGRYPALHTAEEEALGFVSDASPEALLHAALKPH